MATTPQNLPQHVGIIMDGNGRWATRRGLPRKAGHRVGAEAFRKIARHAHDRGIRHLTVYTFSTENWSRPADEIETLMNLLRDYLDELSQYKEENVRICVLGELAPLPEDLRERITHITETTAKNDGMYLNFALNYGGRDEILRAAKGLLRRYSRGEFSSIDAVTATDFEAELYTAGQPDVDLIIRTSGEQRLSNFLLWQSSYAEYLFPETLWPDFSPAHFDEALEAYAARSRRMGGV
jgi:undecaprenyl diphosphate synthase